ncbi:hypothetical protein J132_02228 [Termitomyces sp. J132]|nr:hypothetical protein J132_02228 [Termitomyces sp. J132]
MPPPTSFCKPPTAPHATTAAMPPSPNEPPNYIALCNSMTFSDQADFACIANQSGFSGLLSDTLRLPSSAWDISAGAKAFCFFANAIITINNNHQKLCCNCKHEAEAKHQAQDNDVAMASSSPAPSAKCKANVSPSAHHLNILTHQLNTLFLHLTPSQTEINGKQKSKKVKVTPSVVNYRSGSKTALLILGQVNATLKAISLANGNDPVPHEDLKKQCEAMELAAQQQLHLLNLSLQTYKLIATRLTCLNKALASPDVDLAGLLLEALNVSFESTLKESDIKLATSPIKEPKSSLELPSTPTL